MATSNIVMYYQNCRGIRTKLHTLYMNILSCSYDVIMLTETWLIPGIHDSEFIDDRYIVFRCDRDRLATNKREGGGVLVAVLRELHPTRMTTQFAHAYVEQAVVQLPASQSNKRHIISVAYIPPRTHDDVYIQYLEMLQGIANDSTTESFYIAGDFNLPDVGWVDNGNHSVINSATSSGQLLLNFMSLIDGLQYNKCKNVLGRTLDLFISNADCLTTPCSSLLQPDTHHPVFAIMTHLNMQFTPMQFRAVPRYNYHKADYPEINEQISAIDWDKELSGLPAEQAVSSFYDILYGIIRLHVPLTRIRSSRFPVWFSPSLIRIFKNKERAWAKWKKYHNLYDYEHFSRYRTLFHKESDACFSVYINSVEDSIPRNIKFFWSYISNRKNKASFPASVRLNNISTDNPTDICNLFSTFFASVYEPSTFDPETWQPSNKYGDNSSSIGDIYLSRDVILRTLKSLDPSKGAGPDGLPPAFFIKTADSIHVALYLIFNTCLREGVFPTTWKRAFITPIHKSGEKENVENYRPISILSALSKLFEKLVHGALYPLFHRLIIPEQHGFVKRRSTTTNLMVFTNFLFENMDRQVQVDAVYTDFRKAFDKVDHSILLEKLAFNGIRGNLLRWFASYIFNRTQKVVINGYESDTVTVRSGVPQGSILGPFLFIVYVNDIGKCFFNAQFLMYADDMKIYKSCKSTQDCLLLQDDLIRLHAYCKDNKLFLSLPKCHSVSFTKNNKNKLNFVYSLDGQQLRVVDSVRDLGVIIDSSLHFNLHIDSIVNKAFRMYGFVMRSSRDFVRPSTFLMLYKCLVRSQLEYATPIWNPHYLKYENKLEMVQKKFLRGMNFKCYHSKIPYTDLLEKYKILSLESRRLLLDVMMLHGLCHNRFDCIDITNKICLTVPRTVIRRGARMPRLFHLDSCKTNAGARVPLRRLVETYNTHFMDIDIFSLHNNKFKNLVINKLTLKSKL